MKSPKGIDILRPGRKTIHIRKVVLDFTGTLSVDGRLLPGVRARLRRLARRVHVIVATADSFGTAREALAGLPVETHIVCTGRDKGRLVKQLGGRDVAAVGNGRNDRAMLRKAALGIAVIGHEGTAGALLPVADIVFADVRDALDLFLMPLRAKATLRD